MTPILQTGWIHKVSKGAMPIYCDKCEHWWYPDTDKASEFLEIHRKHGSCDKMIQAQMDTKEVYISVYGDRWKEEWIGTIASFLTEEER